ncbi:MAG: SpoIIE family protein phosphatase [Candidatus Magnetobacterium sp. LHC-1]|nr:SpoIIE family protein phosphatase [Nitrospirota bacterium]
MEEKKDRVRVVGALKKCGESTGIGCILREIYGSRLVFETVGDMRELKSYTAGNNRDIRYDLVVFDRWPVGFDGGMLGAMISDWRGVPFVMIVDDANDMRIDRALRTGVSAILKTPLTYESVALMITPLSRKLDRRKHAREKLHEHVPGDSACMEKLYALLELSRAIGFEIEIENLLDVIVQKTTDVMDAERTTLFLYDDSRNELKSRIAEGLSGVREIRLPVGQGIAGDVAKHRKTVNIPDAYSDKRFNVEVDCRTGYRTRSVLCSAIVGSNKTLMGVIQVINKKGDNGADGNLKHFGEQDERLLEILCGHAAVALERIRLTEACLEKRRIEESLRVAHDIQMNMVPRASLPLLNRGIDLHPCMKAARDVGGDFYDFFFVDHDRLCLTIGDVSGKGVPAALFMVKAMTLLKSTVQTGVTPEEALTIVNRELCTDNRSYMFVTVFLGIFDLGTGYLRYSNGGHNPPYLLCNNGIVPVTGAVGPALGVLEDTLYESSEVEIVPGCSLFMYTDGIEDSRDTEGGFFSIERVEQLLYENRTLSAERLVTAILDAVNEFSEDAPQADDITVLAMRKLSPPKSLELTLTGGLENIPAIVDFIADSSQSLGLSEDVGFDSKLAVEEACTNIIKYAYDGPEQAWLNLSVALTGDKLIITIRDRGRPFDYDCVPAPDLTSNLADRTPGGMGIHFIRQIMEEMSYEHKNGIGVLTLIKHLIQ